MNTANLFIQVVDGRYQAYESLTGIDRRNVGPRWNTPREASAFIRSLADIPETSPIRDAVQGPALTPSAADEAPDRDLAAAGQLALPLVTAGGG